MTLTWRGQPNSQLSGAAERLTTADQGTFHWSGSWAPDGQTLLFSVERGFTDWDIWTLSANDGDTHSLYDTPDTLYMGAELSPDGQWLAYGSGPDLVNDIYVEPFPPTGSRRRISQNGGYWPLWSPNGDRLFYRLLEDNNAEMTVRSVDVATEPDFAYRNEQTLPIEGFTVVPFYRDYDIMPDGERLVMVFPADQSEPGDTSPPPDQSDPQLVPGTHRAGAYPVVMPLQAGTSLGPYQIESPLGAGGMGEVYKATDTRLDRTVAIKVLPEHVAADPDLKQRFEREAKTVAALSHPHICPVFDVGEQDGVNYLVMEYLDGETLQQRLEKGALPLDQALTIAIEIADALDKAHRQGIVHRDLKPGNIMLTKAGAKLLDFGLAKLKPVEQSGGLSALPTQPADLTQEGSILGRFQYMAPEQLEGQEADARTDIFAFGAVVYEMVTGKKAFEGKSQASLIAAILDRDPPPMSKAQTVSPQALDRAVMKCLSKEPDGRWQSASDLRDELAWIAESDLAGAEPVQAGPRGRSTLQLNVVAVLAALIVGAFVLGLALWIARPLPIK